MTNDPHLDALRDAHEARQERIARDDDCEVGGNCDVCGGGLRYGERHMKCGDRLMAHPDCRDPDHPGCSGCRRCDGCDIPNGCIAYCRCGGTGGA